MQWPKIEEIDLGVC